MSFTNEQIIKAKSAKTAEELLAMAKASGITMTEEQAKAYFTELNKQGELNDSELASVAGGSKGEEIPTYNGYELRDSTWRKCEEFGNEGVCRCCSYFKFNPDGQYINGCNGHCEKHYNG